MTAKLLPEKFSELSDIKKAKHLPAPYKLRRYYMPSEVAVHNTANDCWVSLFGEVCDLTLLIQKNYCAEVEPMIKAAGADITHWFDSKTREPKSYINPSTNLKEYFAPNGPYLHLPPSGPSSTFQANFDTPYLFQRIF